MAKKTQLLFSPNPTKAGTAPVSDGDPAVGDEDEVATLIERGVPTQQMLARREIARRCPACERVFSNEQAFCPFDGVPLSTTERPDAPAAHDDPLIGVVVEERYRVEAVIAEGGMGTVYRVRHTKLNSAFAMKVLRRDLAEDENIADRLIDEARATAAIGHPNIVAAADFGEIDKTVLPELGHLKLPFFVMEHLSGYTLAELIEETGALPEQRIARIVSQVASALAAAHREGIVHRDLKPDNIRLIRDDVGNEMAKVVDFGVAKVIGASRKTQKGIVFGTPHYMSPEQGQGDPIDHRTDIYALGVIIYECLTGDVPFVGDTFVGIITQHIHAVPPPLARALRKSRLAKIMVRCLQKHPDARYEAMNDVVAELEPMVTRRPSNTHSGSVLRIPGEQDTARWMWIVGATGVIVAVALAFGMLRTSSGERRGHAATESAGPLPSVPLGHASASAGDKTQASARARSREDVSSANAASPREVAPPASSSIADAASAAAPPAGAPQGSLERPLPAVPPRRRTAPKTSGDVVDPWD